MIFIVFQIVMALFGLERMFTDVYPTFISFKRHPGITVRLKLLRHWIHGVLLSLTRQMLISFWCPTLSKHILSMCWFNASKLCLVVCLLLVS